MARIKLWSPAFNALSLDMDRECHGEYWLAGGRGSGKSTFAARKILLGMRQHPHANALIYRKVANTLRQSVYEEMVKAIDVLGMRAGCQMRLSPLEIRMRDTGQRIMFRGADDPGKSKSITLANGYFGYLWFEELSEFSGLEDIETIRASVIRGKAEQRPLTICTYNPPQSAMNWVNAEALRPRADRMLHHSTYLDLPREWIGEYFIQTAEAMREANERGYRHMYLGEVTGLGGQVFDNLALRPITRKEREAFGHTYAGLDFGWFPDPVHFVRCAYASAERRLYIYDEFRAVKTGNRELCDILTGRKGVTRAEEIIADSAEMKSIADLRAYGLRVVGATKGPGSVRAGIRWLQMLREIVIDPVSCPAAAREFSEYECERTRDGYYVESYPDANNHAIDAVRYAMNRVWMRAGV